MSPFSRVFSPSVQFLNALDACTAFADATFAIRSAAADRGGSTREFSRSLMRSGVAIARLHKVPYLGNDGFRLPVLSCTRMRVSMRTGSFESAAACPNEAAASFQKDRARSVSPCACALSPRTRLICAATFCAAVSSGDAFTCRVIPVRSRRRRRRQRIWLRRVTFSRSRVVPAPASAASRPWMNPCRPGPRGD